MRSTILIDNKYDIHIKDGYTISQELNETLDSGEATFSLDRNLSIEPFDSIAFFYGRRTASNPHPFSTIQKIDNVVNRITNPFENDEIYTYTIKTFSETKLLERTTCPTLSITRPQDGYFKAELNPQKIIGGPEDGFQNAGDVKTFVFDAPAYVDNITTGIFEYSGTMLYFTTSLLTKTISFSEFNTGVSWNQNGQVSVNLKVPDDAMPNRTFTYNFSIGIRYKRSIYYYIKLYCDMYAPKIHIKDGNNIVLKSSIAISDNVKNRFKDIECPEFQWDNPTLREVLNDLMIIDNCIPILKNNTLDFFDLKTTGDEIDKTKLNGIEHSQTSADYCSELTLPMSNSIGNQLIKKIEWVTFRNSDDVELTEDNLQLETQYPIYKISSVIMSYCVNKSGLAGNWDFYEERDITNNIYEEKVWNTLPSPKLNSINNSKFRYFKFKRGSNIIDGFSQRYQAIVGSNVLAIKNFIEVYLANTYSNSDTPVRTLKENVRDIRFKIEYYTIDERKLHIGKYLPTKHAENRIFDQQTSAYIDPNKMSMYEYFKVNRLGNMITTITGSYKNNETHLIPKLGDTLDGEILFSRKMKFSDDIVQFEGYLTKNYILQEYFTSVQAKRRSWSWVDSDEAHTKYEIDKYFMEFSFDNKMTYKDTTNFIEFINTTGLGTQLIEYYFLSPFYNTAYNLNDRAVNMKSVVVKAYGMNHEDCTQNKQYYILDLNVEKMGNSFVATFGFKDNVSAGTYVNYQKDGNTKIWVNDFYKYCDNYAETYSLEYYIVDNQNSGDGDFPWIDEYTTMELTPYGFPLGGDYETGITNATGKSQKRPLATQLYGNIDKLHSTIQVSKDNAEIIKISTQFEFCSDTEDIVIGSRFYELQKIVKSGNNDISNLKIAFSTQKPNIANCEKLPPSETIANLTERWTNFSVSYNNLYIFSTRTEIDTLAWNTQYYAYIYDSSDNNRVVLCVATTREQLDNQGSIVTKPILIYLNALKTRDCNIYDSVENRNIVGNLVDGIQE